MHAAYYYYKHAGLGEVLTKLNSFTFIMSSLCHDVGHRGKNNNFEVSSLSELALLYHDVSVLEQHHAALTMKLLTQSQNNFLDKLKSEDFKKFRKLLIKGILATDMKEHFALIESFQKQIDSLSANRDKLDEDKQTFVMSFFVHVADLNGPSKEYTIADKWSRLVNMEFTNQYNTELKYGLAPTPYFKDLDKDIVYYENEIKFNSVFIAPLLQVANTFTQGKLAFALAHIEKNCATFKLKLEEARASALAQKPEENGQAKAQ